MDVTKLRKKQSQLSRNLICGKHKTTRNQLLFVNKKFIQNEFWKIFEEELIRTLREKNYRDGWDKLRHQFDSYNEFAEFVDETQRAL